MSRTPEQEGAAIARKVVAEQVVMALVAYYGRNALVELHETNTGLQQIRLQHRDGPTFNLTLTKARR